MAKKKYEDDDGRVIASMNVDGMPWYDGRKVETVKSGENSESLNLTKGESRSIIINAMLAGVAIWAVFAGVFGLFIWLLTVWFGV